MIMDTDFSNEELNDAFSDGATPSEPSATYINQLRLQLRAITCKFNGNNECVQMQMTPVSLRKKQLRMLVRLSTIAAAILVAFVTSRTIVGTAAASLRSALDLTRRSAWIHSSTTVTHFGETIERESWCAPVQRITAFRSSEGMHFINYNFDDYEALVIDQLVDSEGILRTSLSACRLILRTAHTFTVEAMSPRITVSGMAYTSVTRSAYNG